MKRHLDRILATVYLSPWAILPDHHKAIVAVLDAHLTNKADFGGIPTDVEEAPAFEVVGSVAVIPIEGTILNKCSGLEAACGAFSLQTFKATLREVAQRSDVASIVLNISSPGGTVTGVPEAADLIAEVAKTKAVYAYADDCIASAAYWLASQTKGIFLSKSARIGSVGVYRAIVDESGAWAQQGLKLELFKAGTFKAMGIPGKPLSDDEKTLIQSDIDRIYSDFTNAITSKRKVGTETMQGQMFMADAAVKNGLADGIVNELDALIDYLNAA